MSGTSSRISSSTSALGIRSYTYPDRDSSSSESPARTGWFRSGSASRTTRSSSAWEMTRARSPSASTSLSMTTSPTFSKPWAMTTLSASFRTTSWPGRSSLSSTFGDTFTRILRPPVNTSAVSSSHALRKIPNPDGGWASRSTSSFSATIWSRASRSVAASRSFCAVTPLRLPSVSCSRSSSSLTCRGESASRRRSTAISSSRNEICAVRLFTSSSCRDTRPPSSLVAKPLTSS